MNTLLELAKKTEEKPEKVVAYLANASKKYRIYYIPKRSHGRRVIAHPAKELKRYQKAFLDIHPLPVHDAAFAYKRGLSIKENAEQHVQNPYLLKLDLENFFNSITPNIFWKQWQQYFKWIFDEPEKSLLEQALFWSTSRKPNSGELVLSVGAPSSPALSNFCLYFFDEDLARHCLEQGISYTRYADDMTFSTQQPEMLKNLADVVKTLLDSHFSGKLLLNYSKTVYSSKAHNRHVTGVTLTNDGKLSLGRKRKRYIKHLVHQFMLENLDDEDTAHLRGLLAFSHHIEPSFVDSLISKYGQNTLQKITEVKCEKKNA